VDGYQSNVWDPSLCQQCLATSIPYAPPTRVVSLFLARELHFQIFLPQQPPMVFRLMSGYGHPTSQSTILDSSALHRLYAPPSSPSFWRIQLRLPAPKLRLATFIWPRRGWYRSSVSPVWTSQRQRSGLKSRDRHPIRFCVLRSRRGSWQQSRPVQRSYLYAAADLTRGHSARRSWRHLRRCSQGTISWSISKLPNVCEQ